MHGLHNNLLYCVNKIILTWEVDGDNSQRETVTNQGTGFFVVKDNNIYLITNRHVVEAPSEYAGKNPTLKKFMVDTRDFDTRTSSVKIEEISFQQWHTQCPTDPQDDVCCIFLPNCSAGATIPHYFGFELLADDADFKAGLSICDEVALIGFPSTSYDHLNNVPILRRGCISSDPRLEYSYNTNFNGHQLAVELFSTGGSSGSPIISLQKVIDPRAYNNTGIYRKPQVIGINAAFLTSNNVHQQIALVCKSSIIRNLILAAEAQIQSLSPTP